MKHSALLTLFVFFLSFSLSANSTVGGEINACKYLVVVDFTSDPYGIAKELRAQGIARGFIVVSSVSEVPQSDVLKTCVMSGSWARNLSGGDLSMRVVDAPSGALVAEAATGATNWWSTKRTVRGAVGNIYSQLGYTGYSEGVSRERILREYPARPKIGDH